MNLVHAGKNKVVVLHGAGGHGKTTVAIDVAETTKRLVWWVDAGSEATLLQGLQALAIAAGALPARVQQAWRDGTGSAPDLLWETLESRTDEWIVILDNADDIDLLAAGQGRLNQYRGWLRRPRNHGVVLVTSRQGHPQVWGDAALLEVGPLSSAEGGQVLLDRAPESGTRAEAEMLAARLGGLPLALWLAGGYLAAARTAPDLPGLTTHTTFPTYLAAWEACFVDVSDLSWDIGPHDERELLEKTWELSLDLLERRGHPVARPLLRVLASLARRPVPLRLVDADPLSSSPLFEKITAGMIGNAVRALVDVGLLDVDAPAAVDSLAMHPVVHDANRYHAQRDSAYRRAALALVASAVRGSNAFNTGEWPFLHTLLPHGQVAIDVAGDASESKDIRLSSSEACHALAMFCEQNGLDREGLDLSSAALACRLDLIGPMAEPTLAARNNRAHALTRLGRFAEAAVAYREVLTAETAARGEAHVETLVTRSALTSLLRRSGELREAEREARAMLDIMNRAESEYDHTLIPAAFTLGLTLCDLGELSEAEMILRKEFALARQAYGAHPYTIEVMSALATVFRSRGENEALAELAEEMIRATTAMFGPEHDRTLAARSFRAAAMMEFGNPAQAEEEFRDVLTSLRQTKDDRHPAIIQARRSLAIAMLSNGKVRLAENELWSLLADERSAFEDDETSPESKVALAGILVDRGEYSEAEKIYRDILKVRQKQGAAGTLDFTVRHQLAHCLLESGKPADAERECRTALKNATTLLSKADSDLAKSYNLLAACLLARNEPRQALDALDRAISIQAETGGEAGVSMLTARANKGMIHHRLGSTMKAYAELLSIHEDAKRAGLSKHPKILGINFNIAFIAHQIGKSQTAIGILRTALDDAIEVMGNENSVILRLRYGLGSILSDLHQDDEARDHLEPVANAIQAGRVGDRAVIDGTRSALALINSRRGSQ